MKMGDSGFRKKIENPEGAHCHGNTYITRLAAMATTHMSRDSLPWQCAPGDQCFLLLPEQGTEQAERNEEEEKAPLTEL